MARSTAATPDAYLAELEPERSAELGRVREVVNAGPTYNKQPLVYAALAARKNYNALYLNCVYASPERSERLAAAFANAGPTSSRSTPLRANSPRSRPNRT